MLWGPIYEEFLLRILLQEMLLKKIPEKILQRVSPARAHLTHQFLTKIARVFTSSVFFALAHAQGYTCGNGDLYPYFFGGTILGMLQEVSGHPVYNTIAHMAANYLILKDHCYEWPQSSICSTD